jgi:protein-L-isoaspartate(D-aspartate) O-methyltransferase
MLTEAAPQPEDRALVVGAATGYAAAVLAQLVGSVVALEEDPALVVMAGEALSGTGVKLVEGPLTKGHKAGAPYDLILIDGAVEFVPDAIVGQLAENGRLAVAMLVGGVAQISIGRRGGAGFGTAAVSDAASAILPGFAKPRGFTF